MPSALYPDGPNVYLAEGIRAALRERDLETPVVATGKIRTATLAESILEQGRADLIGMARQLLADPDWPKKVRDGDSDRVVPCVYNNVCKALDERFHRVRCTLWRKGDLHAPLAPEADDSPPRWPAHAALGVTPGEGRIRLEWPAASDDHEVYGYLIERSEDEGPWLHVYSLRGVATRYDDSAALGDATYRYRVTAYDLSGNRSRPLEGAHG
jgi:hypothetical protein